MLGEYRLALEIFQRPPSFDPESDAIVRVETGRLRHRLEAYYEAEGRGDPVLIKLPPRTYVPVFEQRYPAASGGAAERSLTRLFRTRWATGGLAALLLLAVAAISWMAAQPGGTRSATAVGARGLSIVVLPLADLSPAKDQDYFCEGLTTEVLEMLTKVEGLRVVSRASALRFKSKLDDLRSIASQLNVRLVLDGSVRREGTHLRVAVQLVNAEDGYHIWSQSFDREMKDVFAIQRDIARGVVAALRSQLARAHWLRPIEEYAPSLDAYNLYLNGLHFAHQMSEERLRKAIAYFEQAVAADPKYAEAYADLAESYALLGVHAGAAPGDAMTKARSAARKALALDSTLPDAHAALGLVEGIHDWNWAEAAREFQRALELDPTDSSVLEAHVMGYLVPTGRLDDALKEILEARQFDPVSARIDAGVGMVYYFQRHYDQALAQFRQALELEPEFGSAYLAMASVYEQQSRFAEAIAAVQKGAMGWQSGMAGAFLGHTYALMGRKAEALEVAGELDRLSSQKYVSPTYVAAIHTGLGDKDRAFQWLEKAHAQRSASLAYLKVNPRFDSLRSDRRFIDLLRRMHLE